MEVDGAWLATDLLSYRNPGLNPWRYHMSKIVALGSDCLQLNIAWTTPALKVFTFVGETYQFSAPRPTNCNDSDSITVNNFYFEFVDSSGEVLNWITYDDSTFEITVAPTE